MAYEAVRDWTSKTGSPGTCPVAYGAVRDWATIGFPCTCHWIPSKLCPMLAATCQIRSWPSALLILRISLNKRRAIAIWSLFTILRSRASLDRRPAKVNNHQRIHNSIDGGRAGAKHQWHNFCWIGFRNGLEATQMDTPFGTFYAETSSERFGTTPDDVLELSMPK